MAKMEEKIIQGYKFVSFYVSEIRSVETAIKWLEIRLKENKFDIKYYSYCNPESYHDGGFEHFVDTFEELKIKIDRYKTKSVSIINCKFIYNKESVWLTIDVSQSEIGFMIPSDSKIDIDELAEELEII